MNPATGAVIALSLLLALAVLLAADRVAERITASRAAPAGETSPAPEDPESRAHEPGGCWCGNLHEGAPAGDRESSWEAS